MSALLLERQAGEANAGGVNLVANVEANQQSRDGLDDACVFQLSAVQCAGTGDFRREFARNAFRLVVVAANENVAINWTLLCKQFRADIVERRGEGD